MAATDAYLEQPSTKVRSDNKLDPLDLGLSEHNLKMFFLGRRGIGSQQLDGLRL